MLTREGFDQQMKYNPNFPWALLSTIRNFPLRTILLHLSLLAAIHHRSIIDPSIHYFADDLTIM